MGLDLYLLGCRVLLGIVVVYAAMAVEGNRTLLVPASCTHASYTMLAGSGSSRTWQLDAIAVSEIKMGSGWTAELDGLRESSSREVGSRKNADCGERVVWTCRDAGRPVVR